MQKLNITLKAFDSLYLSRALSEIRYMLFSLNFSNLQTISYPPKSKIITVIRSPHIDKKSREQFQWKRYKKQIIAQSLPENNHSCYTQLSLFLFFLKNCEFPGTELKLTLRYSSFFISK